MRRRTAIFFFKAEDGIRDLVRSRGLGDVYKRQAIDYAAAAGPRVDVRVQEVFGLNTHPSAGGVPLTLSLIHI